MLQFLSFTLGCESDRSDDIDVIADRREPILYADTSVGETLIHTWYGMLQFLCFTLEVVNRSESTRLM